jgi:hypothetical protein
MMSTKTTKIIYWIATILIAAFTLPGLFFMNSEMAVEGIKNVGLEGVTRLQQLLGYAPSLAVLAILFLPKSQSHLKEWAYAGLAFVYIGAFWAHVQLGQTAAEIAMPVVTFIVLMTSHYMWHKLMKGASMTK